MNMHEGTKESPEQVQLRKLKRLLGMAESLKHELSHCSITGDTVGDLGSTAILQVRSMVASTKQITGDDFVEMVLPELPADASDDRKIKAALMALSQYIGYMESVIEESDPPPSANVKESVNRAVDGIERGFESLSKYVGGEEGRKIAESIRDAIEKAIGSKFASKPRHQSSQESTREPEDAEFTEEPKQEPPKDTTP